MCNQSGGFHKPRLTCVLMKLCKDPLKHTQTHTYPSTYKTQIPVSDLCVNDLRVVTRSSLLHTHTELSECCLCPLHICFGFSGLSEVKAYVCLCLHRNVDIIALCSRFVSCLLTSYFCPVLTHFLLKQEGGLGHIEGLIPFPFNGHSHEP